MTTNNIELLARKALAIRINSLQATTAAGSGHPTSCLSAADLIAVLFFHVLKHDYKNPAYHNNDRFILSKGHAIPVVYAALCQMGVISEQELLTYRHIDSVLEGHPTPRFVHNEAATGSLGQGLSVGLGMALNAKYEQLSYRTYVMLGDAEIAEGSVWEAVELAAHYNVDNLVALVDCNKLGQSDTSLHAHHVDRYAKQFEAFGWKSFVIDGHNLQQIIDVFDRVQQVRGQPCVIVAKTRKGYGLPAIEDKLGFHGKPFSAKELPQLIDALRTRFAQAASYGDTIASDELQKKQLPEKISVASKQQLTTFELQNDPTCAQFTLGKNIATRKAFGYALDRLGSINENVFVFDGDVKNSTYTEFFEQHYPRRFVQCFVAEQNMIGVASGFALRGKIPFAATFASFFSRCYDQVRMAGIGRVPLRLCGSHSGVSIGADGPSQMGLEDLAMFRVIPQSIVFWPSDGVSTYKIVQLMAAYHDGVSYIKTTRADTPILYDMQETFSIGGCKVLRSSSNDKACIVAAGITVSQALKAYEVLAQQGISVSVIDLYAIKPLDSQTVANIAARSNNMVLTVEDHYPQGGLGEAVASALQNTGIKIHSLAVHKLPRSGTPEELMKFEEIDADAIVRKILILVV